VKISQSVRALYGELKPTYDRLKQAVDDLITAKKSSRWHYESRVKEEQSFAQKLETGREPRPDRPEDLLGVLIVVENHSRIPDAEKIIADLFKVEWRRPPEPKKTWLKPQNFDFDDLRVYVSWKDNPALKPTGLEGLVFEVQIKTFLQHAWGIATHDLVYKSDEVAWGATRVAYQVKAMLENAELSISEAKKLTASSLLARSDAEFDLRLTTINAVKDRWPSGALPRDLARLAGNIIDLASALGFASVDEVWAIVDAASAAGRGAKILDLSPYGAVLDSLVAARGAGLFDKLKANRRKTKVFVPSEIELPELSAEAKEKLIFPKLPSARRSEAAPPNPAE
jgi:ppGpp synthetase/RelA/SpoT-type nucleotidyltranferase